MSEREDLIDLNKMTECYHGAHLKEGEVVFHIRSTYGEVRENEAKLTCIPINTNKYNVL